MEAFDAGVEALSDNQSRLERFLAKPPPMNMAVANCFPGVRLQPPPRDRRPGYV